MEEMKVKVEGGTLVATKSPDPNYPGIALEFERADGFRANLVVVEAPEDVVNLYVYGNAFSDDFTQKCVLTKEDLTRDL